MTLKHDLPHFKLTEFKHPELVAADAAEFLEAVRVYYGAPIRLTSDARTAAENALVGGSELSWHVKGRAFDLRWPASDSLTFQLVAALFAVAAEWAKRPVLTSLELELVYSETDKHIHFAVKDNGSPDRLIVAAD